MLLDREKAGHLRVTLEWDVCNFSLGNLVFVYFTIED